jgi:hypothetical protein
MALLPAGFDAEVHLWVRTAEPPHLVGGEGSVGQGGGQLLWMGPLRRWGRAHPSGDGRPDRVVC